IKKLKNKKIFVFANKKVNISDNFFIEKYDVGIIESKTKNGVLIFFVRVWKTAELNRKDFNIFDVKKSGDAFPKKICNICHKLLDTNKFSKNQNGINNRSVRRPSCSDCRKNLEGVNITAKTKAEWNKNKPQYVPFDFLKIYLYLKVYDRYYKF